MVSCPLLGGLLGKICDKQRIPYEYGKGRLEERFQLLEEIRKVKPTQVCIFEIRNVICISNLADVCREQGLLMINYRLYI